MSRMGSRPKGAFQRVLQLHQRLGGKEGSAPHAARSETKGLAFRDPYRSARRYLSALVEVAMPDSNPYRSPIAGLSSFL
jgi:hypothetical protein